MKTTIHTHTGIKSAIAAASAARTLVLSLSLVGALLATAVQAQECCRPRSTVDATRTDRLIGKPPKADGLDCPSGQVFSGGSCIVMPSPSTPYEPAWTKYFVGQIRCGNGRNPGYWAGDSSHRVCVLVNADASLTATFEYHLNGSNDRDQRIFNAPSGRTNGFVISKSGFCGSVDTFMSATVSPVFTADQIINGNPPGDFIVSNVGCGY